MVEIEFVVSVAVADAANDYFAAVVVVAADALLELQQLLDCVVGTLLLVAVALPGAADGLLGVAYGLPDAVYGLPASAFLPPAVVCALPLALTERAAAAAADFDSEKEQRKCANNYFF